jgi:hypothetical protein
MSDSIASHAPASKDEQREQHNTPKDFRDDLLHDVYRLTTQAQRPGARDATIANRDAMPGSLQRMVRCHQSIHALILVMLPVWPHHGQLLLLKWAS